MQSPYVGMDKAIKCDLTASEQAIELREPGQLTSSLTAPYKYLKVSGSRNDYFCIS